MTRRISGKRQARLVDALCHAEQDVINLAQSCGLTPADLGRWARDGEYHEVLVSLARLADLQTQVLLSRYRHHAVHKLIQQATEDKKANVTPEQARKACVDLMRLDLRSVHLMRDTAPSNPEDTQTLYDALYGGIDRRAAEADSQDDPTQPDETEPADADG